MDCLDFVRIRLAVILNMAGATHVQRGAPHLVRDVYFNASST
jgi:hypothetical protein